ncbi:LytR/AlgR family response regulator transcription factor [Seonamhaeicola marinus]|uniref:Response regulator transcription factor n=1 Tax=Seonamhaeicola marinus TaxID=1912246 RepID=A0A5D0HSE9_9FLAO|nr:LytTR family DNA-binding domain-containing protein [Seonamhaeicola marinus]TYA74208.1 response regulator transcription factor [Seonamhaeicola marinus]
MKKPYSVLIIDDERLARIRLKNLLETFSESFEVSGEAENGYEALSMIKKLKPEIIFLDIEMPGMSGFEVLKRLNTMPLVIFCTAFEDYSLKAFETNSLDYLIKPVKKERLQQTVQKIEQLKANFSKDLVVNAINSISEIKEKKRITSITVKKGDKIVFVKLNNISHFEATEKYVTLYTNSSSEIIEQSLTQLEKKLPDNFLRVHRSFLVNTDYVTEFQKYFNNRYIINLNNSNRTVITSGRTYKEAIKTYLNQ